MSIPEQMSRENGKGKSYSRVWKVEGAWRGETVSGVTRIEVVDGLDQP
jgi:hypothetical protein